jgi:hypothetical protein
VGLSTVSTTPLSDTALAAGARPGVVQEIYAAKDIQITAYQVRMDAIFRFDFDCPDRE